jgi:hypothetical protein
MGLWTNPTLTTVCNLLTFVIVLLLIVIGLTSGLVHKAGLEDPNNIRRYQVGLGGVSLDDRVYDASQKKSGLTGSRDIPVFFQDYDYEMVKKGANMYTSREGLSDERSPESEIEKRMLGG